MDRPARSTRRPPANAGDLRPTRRTLETQQAAAPVRRYLGIDPGLGGALALLRIENGGQSITVIATPVDWVPVSSGKRRRYAIDQIDHLVRTLTPITFA